MDYQKKERIKDRMLKTASRIWNIPENELEANYDPLVLLMMEACAAELEKIGFDIQASHNRLLDKLAEVMLPEIATSPKPPSAVMQATPIEANTVLDENAKFFCTQRIAEAKQTANADVYFTPIGKFPLLNVTLKNILIGDKVYSVKQNGSKETLCEKNNDDTQPVFEIELALQTDASLKSMTGLSLFFDLRNHADAQAFYNHLQSCKISVDEKPVVAEPGYALAEQFELNPQTMLTSGNNHSEKVKRQLAGTYQKQFLHINDPQPLSGFSTEVPESWKRLLNDEVLKKDFSEPAVFIKLRLSRPFPRYVLESLMISVNAFPVVSRKLNTLTYRTNEWVNIIPLHIEGSFLDLHDVSSSNGSYNFRIIPQQKELDKGETTIRNGGIGKANSTDVREIVNSLTLAIRDESAYFTDVSNDFILNRLRDINHILTRLQDQLSQAKDLQAQHTYLLIKPKQTGESVTINYWTTHIANARQIKAYTSVSALQQTLVNSKTAYIITNVVGGKSQITEAEKRNYLKQQITSRGKIVSVEDVKLLAFELFGDKLKKVEIHKTIQSGSGSNQGFSRTIQVVLHLQKDAFQNNADQLQYQLQEMEYLLMQNASPVYPYKVMVA